MSSAPASSPPAARICDPVDPRWQRLRTLVAQHSLLRGTFTLSSGRTSTYLFQLRQTTLLPEGQYLIGSLLIDFMREKGLRAIGGLEVGAIPVVTAAAFASHLAHHEINAFFVRKSAKGHGARELIGGHVLPGEDVLFVDDVTTSGQSVATALDTVNTLPGLNVTAHYAASVIDREEGASALLGARGMALHSIFSKSDFDI